MFFSVFAIYSIYGLDFLNPGVFLLRAHTPKITFQNFRPHHTVTTNDIARADPCSHKWWAKKRARSSHFVVISVQSVISGEHSIPPGCLSVYFRAHISILGHVRLISQTVRWRDKKSAALSCSHFCKPAKPQTEKRRKKWENVWQALVAVCNY